MWRDSVNSPSLCDCFDWHHEFEKLEKANVVLKQLKTNILKSDPIIQKLYSNLGQKFEETEFVGPLPKFSTTLSMLSEVLTLTVLNKAQQNMNWLN